MSNLEAAIAYHQSKWPQKAVVIARQFEKLGVELDPPTWAKALDGVASKLPKPRTVTVKPASYARKDINQWLAYVASIGPLTLERATASGPCPIQCQKGRQGFLKYEKERRQGYIDDYLASLPPQNQLNLADPKENPFL